MTERPVSGPVTIEAPGKVNLFLRIVVREDSGYHQIETLFQAVDLLDSLILEPGSAGVELEVSGADVGPATENLVFRAAQRFMERVEGDGIRIRLEKRIPAGSGLGGGSSDAGAALRAMNRLWGEPLTPRQLTVLAGGLGADVPFFASGSSLALAWGRGDRLLPLRPLPSAPLLLCLPPHPVSTVSAYEWVADLRGSTAGAAGSVLHDPSSFERWPALWGLMENDFEAVVFARHGKLAELRAALLKVGATRALLSGSGSALFALFEEETEMARAGRELAAAYPDTEFVTTRTLECVPPPRPPVGLNRSHGRG
jgi:4-diphosphocytidyl-2-C-methyl-D-erythritol kinase